jgi:hypothetical protein
VIVKLVKPHTDAGKDYAPGDTLDVDEATAQWLIEHGVAENTTQTPLEPKKPTRKGD